ncbi:hypothetical protein N431DRAFT_468380 [Stipitochalara longipes BDJ]|nr:hypothetical protein N431DRAFT_468380 [Stipitochalara longipes BDJ]
MAICPCEDIPHMPIGKTLEVAFGLAAIILIVGVSVQFLKIFWNEYWEMKEETKKEWQRIGRRRLLWELVNFANDGFELRMLREVVMEIAREEGLVEDDEGGLGESDGNWKEVKTWLVGDGEGKQEREESEDEESGYESGEEESGSGSDEDDESIYSEGEEDSSDAEVEQWLDSFNLEDEMDSLHGNEEIQVFPPE